MNLVLVLKNLSVRRFRFYRGNNRNRFLKRGKGMKWGRIKEFNQYGRMCKTEIEFWSNIFEKHSPINLKHISRGTGLDIACVREKIKGRTSLTVPQWEYIREFFKKYEFESFKR